MTCGSQVTLRRQYTGMVYAVAGVSRRTVVAGGLGVAGAAALGAVALSASTDSAVKAAADVPLIRSRFAPFVDTVFTAGSAAGTFPLRLDVIDDLIPVRMPEDDDRFNLLFAPLEEEPPQGIYTLHHPEADAVTLFLSPIGHHGAIRIQAVVDRSL